MQKDPAGTLKKLAEIGYREVELASLGKLTAAQMPRHGQGRGPERHAQRRT